MVIHLPACLSNGEHLLIWLYIFLHVCQMVNICLNESVVSHYFELQAGLFLEGMDDSNLPTHSCAHTSTHTTPHTCMHAHAHTHACTHTHTHTHTHSHTHTHTHTHSAQVPIGSDRMGTGIKWSIPSDNYTQRSNWI